MIVGALAELLAATSLCWSLYRKRTGFARQVLSSGINVIDLADVHAQELIP
jgi:hypothetical protein